ncbi:MAG: ADP-ribosylglycohydrolase family protein [Cetobacterium sp.]
MIKKMTNSNITGSIGPTESQFIGVLMSGCIGDVLGSYNENLTFDQIRTRKRITKEFINTKFTDDTELTIILAQYLIKYYNNANHSMVPTVHNMYQNIVKYSKRGYSRKTKHLLSNWHDCMPAYNSDTNGSVMRIAPLALIKVDDDKDLYSKIKNAIYCTHGENKDAIDTSFLHVKLIQYLLHNSSDTPDELDPSSGARKLYSYALSIVQMLQNSNLYPLLIAINFENKKTVLNPTLDSSIDEDYLKINVTKNIFGYNLMQIKAIHCYTIVLTCFLYNYDKPIDALIMAANVGGDTDTIAKIIGDLIGAKYGTNWIPESWKQPEHHNEIADLGKQLWTLYSSTNKK